MLVGGMFGCETGIGLPAGGLTAGLIAGAGVAGAATGAGAGLAPGESANTGLGRLGAAGWSSTRLSAAGLSGETGLAGVMTGGGKGAGLAGCWTGIAGAALLR